MEIPHERAEEQLERTGVSVLSKFTCDHCGTNAVGVAVIRTDTVATVTLYAQNPCPTCGYRNRRKVVPPKHEIRR